MKTIRTLLATALIASLSAAALAQTASVPAYTPAEWSAVMRALPAADAKAGSALHTQRFCSGCHGPMGLMDAGATPNIAAQPVEVTVKALFDYRTDRRKGNGPAAMMTNMTKMLTDADIVNLAAHYACLPAAKADTKAKAQMTGDKLAQARRLEKKGDAARMITPCGACHGYSAAGNPNLKVPVLHGQLSGYLEATLRHYRSGERTADILSEMRFFAKSLTDEEIALLAAYYASMDSAARPEDCSETSAK